MKLPTLVEMLEAGLHFGHQTSRWHPKMREYIFGERGGVHIIDLQKTLPKMEETLTAVKRMAAEGKTILFVTTKPQAKAVVKAAAESCGMPYLVDRWIGGLLTNFPEMRKRIQWYNDLKEKQANGELEKYTKKERVDIAKDLEKKDVSLGGLTTLTHIPDAIFVPALQREKTAVVEANRTGVDVIGMADSNANPNTATYFIPGNDDAVRGITLVVNLIAAAINEGKAEAPKQDAATVDSSSSKNETDSK